ncbi:hypothetical protein KUH03_21680 [Sphingobacterium sp. E70]|uniref:hypothetical protein n=1 Tax=Sphingobacterium sp. E70 TaxID=2853439 RepID=UPI00211BD854|nr:hypothetical protein [Sphingobacterium sp. E70]ULT22118.1 hypothetical protein KUH03_21680 [Sphingobacterium sp. E70]
MLVGYFIGIISIPKFVSQQTALRICTIVGITFTAISAFSTGLTSYIFVALLGIANALMWPAIFPLGIKGLGRFTKTGSGIMIMGIAGGAIWPLIYGYLKDTLHVDFQHAFLLQWFQHTYISCFLPQKGTKSEKKINIKTKYWYNKRASKNRCPFLKFFLFLSDESSFDRNRDHSTCHDVECLIRNK